MFRITGGVANKLFRRIQVISAGLMAFSHGSNDAQKVMGIITLALVSGGFLDRVEIQN
jgi:PiT family inorganic phosphate transporter